ncbi:MAG: DUF5056 domain-containing protein [Verrucomicrobiota bacterium]|nr:DUF5056 domain-containing protein [Verrucomicrobiota bacterium]
MDEQLEDDWLDARLRDESPYLDDDGFTARVVQKLPARRHSRSLRTAILLCATIVASVVAYLLSGGGAFLGDAAAFLVAMPLSTVCALAGVSALLVMVGGGAAALSKSRELRS